MNLKTVFFTLKLFVGYVLALMVVATIHPDLMNTELVSHQQTFGHLFADFVLPLFLVVLGSWLIEVIISTFNCARAIVKLHNSPSKETEKL